MKLIVKPVRKLKGEAVIPSSKSHTIRAIIIASLAEGISKIKNPLDSADTKAAVNGCKALGAKINQENKDEWIIEGFDGKPVEPKEKIDTLNSGTSTNLLMSVAALGNFKVIIDGDDSIRQRTVQPLIGALNKLGAKVKSINNNGCPPIEIQGPIKGGKTEIDCKSSQYISSLLISCPLVGGDTEIILKNVCEQPYIEMTMRWLDGQGIEFTHKGFESIKIKGKQKYKSFEKTIPADWSSATFILCAAAITESDVLIKGLDINDTQGDKAVMDYLKQMGADIRVVEEGILVRGKTLLGQELDLNKTPDALPAISIVGCFAEGTTIIKNVAHARIKETDRINVMKEELSKMGADIQETEDGLVIKKSKLKGAKVNGHDDHRVVMALSLAGLIADGTTEIETAEAINVTFPDYVEIMKNIGANMEVR